MDRHQVAAALERMAALLEVTGANPFRIRAYTNGARIIAGRADFAALVAEDRLTSIKGIGAGLADHIRELLTTGAIGEYEQLRQQVPTGVIEMLAIPGVGPKTARKLWKELSITSIDELAAACAGHRLADVVGMGAKTEQKILHGIDYLRGQHGQHLFPTAWQLAVPIRERLRAHPAVLAAEIAGSLRRRMEIVKDIDLVASTNDPSAVMTAFIEDEAVDRVIAHGETASPGFAGARSRSAGSTQCTTSSILLTTGIQADLRCVPPEAFPYALLHFTGSTAHNTALRGRAQQHDMQLNEYGLFRHADGTEQLVPCDSEATIYRALGLDEVPPELREDRGEIALAAAHTLPTLVTREAVRGIFHCHTTDSDGRASLAEMTAAAQQRGWAYLGISDHSQSVHYARGLEPARVRAQWSAIDRHNATRPRVRVFKGTEVDILKDGSLDYPDELLAGFDFVIASVHTHFSLSTTEMTERVLRALRHPAVRVLAHPTGRLLLSRAGFSIDLEAVLRAAGALKVVVEINANPKRAELDWRHGALAREYGVLTMLSPDAHTIDGLDHVDYGVGIARKGGWSAAQVINTWPLTQVERWLATKRPTN